MDILSYAIASKQSRRLKRFIANPDSNSGIITTPSKIEAGETITIPYGRTATLPDIIVEGDLLIEGDVFIPAGGSYNQINIVCDNIKSNDKTVNVVTKEIVDTVKNQDILGVKNFTNGLAINNENLTPYTGFKNLLINGNLQVWQRGYSFTPVPAGTRIADMWVAYGNSSMNFTGTVGLNMAYYLNIPYVTGQACGLGNRVECNGSNAKFFSGKTFTMSHELYFNIAPASVISWGVYLSHSGGYSLILEGSITYEAGRNKKSCTFTIPDLSAYTLTSASYLEFRPIRDLSASIVATQNIGFYGCQVEQGSNSTPFEHRLYGQELNLCSRYYQISYGGNTAYANSGTAVQRFGVPFSTHMRLVPTCVVNIIGGNGTTASAAATYVYGCLVGYNSGSQGIDISVIVLSSAEL